MPGTFNSTHYLWEPFFVDMVHHNYFMVTAGGRTSRAASKANYPFKLAIAWNENKPFIYKQSVASKVLCNLCKKNTQINVLGTKLQNHSLVHTHLPTNIETPSWGFDKQVREVECHILITAALHNWGNSLKLSLYSVWSMRLCMSSGNQLVNCSIKAVRVATKTTSSPCGSV